MRVLNPKRSSLRASLQMGLIALPLAIVLVVGLVYMAQDHSVRTDERRRFLAAINEGRANAVDRVVSDLGSEARAIAASTPVRDMAPSGAVAPDTHEAIQTHLDDLHQHLAETDARHVSVMNADGRIVASSRAESIGSMAPHRFIERVIARGPHVEPAASGSQHDVITFFAPVRRDGDFVGVVILEGEARAAFEIVQDLANLGETGESYLVDLETSRMITASRFLPHDERPIVETAIVARSIDQPRSLASYADYRGVSVIGAARRLENAPWLLVTEIDRAEVRAAMWGGWSSAIALALLLVFLLTLEGWRRIDSIVSTIERLRQAQRSVEGGNFDVHITSDRLDELGDLTRGFTDMLASLRASQLETLRAETMYRALFEGSVDTLLLTDNNGIVRANRAAVEMFGFESEDDFAGLRIADVSAEMQDGRPTEDVVEELEAVIASGGSQRIDWTARRADGTQFEAEVSVSVIPLAGRNLHQLVVRDVTSRQRALDELIKARESAERANRSKTEFFAKVSHEIRTPMNAILGFSQLLITDPGLNRIQREHARSVLHSGEHLLTLLDDVIDMSKIETGQVELREAPTKVDVVLEGIVEGLRDRLRDGVSLSLAYPWGPLPRGIVCDANRLRQIVVNLCRNALDCTTHGEITVSAWYNEEELVVRVKDDGPEIDSGLVDTVFEAFTQTDDSGRRISGTGLGLAISRNLAESMGGSLKLAKRADGVGSLFTLRIPARIAERAGPDRSVSVGRPRVALGQVAPRVLVVDDEPLNRQLIRRKLERCGCEVVEARDGRDAIEMIESSLPDLVFMDLHMPVMGGLDAVRELRGDHSADDLPVIIISGAALDETKRKAEAAGANAFIVKPFRAGEIERAAADALDVVVEYGEGSDMTPTSEIILDEGALNVMPAHLRDRLREHTVAGDVVALRRLVPQLETVDPEIGRQVGKLVKRFDFDAILALVDDPSRSMVGAAGE